MSSAEPGRSAMKNVDQLDKNMQVQGLDGKDWQWISPRQSPVQIHGLAWLEQEGIYRRLPKNPAWELPPAVDSLANCTAGAQIRFSTNSPRLAIRVRLSAPAGMYHMPATGQCGFDCYIGAPGAMRYFSTTRYDRTLTEYECGLFDSQNTEIKHLTLNFPLYQGVEEVWLGVEPGSDVQEAPAYEHSGRIVFYGTSITQGGCASRPGMAFTNILSRSLNRECINLGFSGNGKGEPALAHIISEIPDVDCYVLDYDANVASVEAMQETLPEFIRILREKHPQTPILVISRVLAANEFYNQEALEKRLGKTQVQANTVAHLREQGDRNISFLDGSRLMGEASLEGTVDGSHPTDLGFWEIAKTLTPVLRDILNH
jgi:lysophospholipase L1-like esterase